MALFKIVVWPIIFLTKLTGISIATVLKDRYKNNIDLPLIRVFERTSQTDVNANTSNIYMHSYVSINILRIRVYRHIHTQAQLSTSIRVVAL